MHFRLRYMNDDDDGDGFLSKSHQNLHKSFLAHEHLFIIQEKSSNYHKCFLCTGSSFQFGWETCFTK